MSPIYEKDGTLFAFTIKTLLYIMTSLDCIIYCVFWPSSGWICKL